jgi:hypothetical protein
MSEMSLGMEECKIPARARNKMFLGMLVFYVHSSMLEMSEDVSFFALSCKVTLV